MKGKKEKRGIILFKRIHNRQGELLQETVEGCFELITSKRAKSLTDDRILCYEDRCWILYPSSNRLDAGELVETTRILFDGRQEIGEETRSVLITVEGDPNWSIFQQKQGK